MTDEKRCNCELLTPDFMNKITRAIWAAEDRGDISGNDAETLEDRLAKLAEGCGIVKANIPEIWRPLNEQPYISYGSQKYVYGKASSLKEALEQVRNKLNEAIKATALKE